jgi:pimeloyl-ACP methyl ester carboxylesterase
MPKVPLPVSLVGAGWFAGGAWPVDPQKSTLVFIHGSGGSSILWDNQLKTFGNRANLLALDLPGHGRSPGTSFNTVPEYTQAVMAFINQMQILKPIPAGLSLGGAITLQLLLDYPERFFAGGGTSLRGFGLNQAGPRDPCTGFPIGGQAMLVFNQDLRFPMHLPLIGDRLGGAVFYDAGNVFPSIREITLRTSAPVPTIGTIMGPNNLPTTVCLTNCTNQMKYFSHTVGFEFRYGTPIGPVALALGYQLNPGSFVNPVTVNGNPGVAVSRVPGFQFFVNLGTSF